MFQDSEGREKGFDHQTDDLFYVSEKSNYYNLMNNLSSHFLDCMEFEY